MGKDLYEFSTLAKERFAQADEILGFRISDTMFNGSIEDLKQTKVTQPAVFLHSVILAEILKNSLSPDMVSGHSLGEFSALVVAGGVTFEDGLKLVSARANAMQAACEITPSTMAAVLGLENNVVEEICKNIDGNVVLNLHVKLSKKLALVELFYFLLEEHSTQPLWNLLVKS